MRKYYRLTTSLLALAACVTGTAARAAVPVYADEHARQTPQGLIITPATSMVHPELPNETHTNFNLVIPNGRLRQSSAPIPFAQTPGSLACIAKLLPSQPATCNVFTTQAPQAGGSRVIAIVDAFDYPTAMNDLSVFSTQFGLPAPTSDTLQIVYASGTKPSYDKKGSGGWEAEEALDLEMAHAMAPNAKLILVEATNSSLPALLQAESVAVQMVSAAGGGEVSNSWGANVEPKNSVSTEGTFTAPNTVVFVAAGDTPYPSYRATLPNVVGVGGTEVVLDKKGNVTTQIAWPQTGSGVSKYVPVPAFQSSNSAVATIVGKHRGTPDVSFDASNLSPVSFYDTSPYKGAPIDWGAVGGTSAASPAVAGIVNNVGSFHASATDELNEIYANIGTSAFFDVTVGQCPQSATGRPLVGYDLCTGVGTPTGLTGK